MRESSEGVILLVGHASSLDECTRCLQGLSARQAVEFSKIVQKGENRCGFQGGGGGWGNGWRKGGGSGK